MISPSQRDRRGGIHQFALLQREALGYVQRSADCCTVPGPIHVIVLSIVLVSMGQLTRISGSQEDLRGFKQMSPSHMVSDLIKGQWAAAIKRRNLGSVTAPKFRANMAGYLVLSLSLKGGIAPSQVVCVNHRERMQPQGVTGLGEDWECSKQCRNVNQAARQCYPM